MEDKEMVSQKYDMWTDPVETGDSGSRKGRVYIAFLIRCRTLMHQSLIHFWYVKWASIHISL
jgi:hypothetical protein